VTVDRRNDLASVRISGRPAGAAPLWQAPRRTRPAAGDPILLVGSPFGLAGTVTTGVVSRVTRRAIQTDAAANPGNSGGPAIDRRGRIVGVLVAGGGQNVNFAVPIAKACVRLRDC
jgi:S1-C subfamily serine protease